MPPSGPRGSVGASFATLCNCFVNVTSPSPPCGPVRTIRKRCASTRRQDSDGPSSWCLRGCRCQVAERFERRIELSSMASEPQFLPPPPEPAPLSPVPVEKPARPGRRTGIVAIVLASAIIGGLVGSAATILLAPRLIKVTPSGTTVVAPLAPVTNNLTEESAVISVAAQAGKAVVEIKTTITVPDIIQQEQHGIGSGFSVRSDGYIVTNNHVVENARQLQVILRDQAKAYDARVVGTSPDDDVAVLKVDAQSLPTLSFGDSSALKVGQLAIAIGSPLGQQNSVTKGVISALHRSISVPDPATGNTENILNAIQTDAQINPGNSGGPLLNSAGQVVGVNFAIEQAQAGPGLGFALDGNAARDIANQLIQTGHVNRPFLGVTYNQLDETAAAASGLVVGAAVTAITPGSPADRAGIKVQDVITKVNGQSIDDSHPLTAVLPQYAPGTKVSVTIYRGGKNQTLQVTLGTHP